MQVSVAAQQTVEPEPDNTAAEIDEDDGKFLADALIFSFFVALL